MARHSNGEDPARMFAHLVEAEIGRIEQRYLSTLNIVRVETVYVPYRMGLGDLGQSVVGRRSDSSKTAAFRVYALEYTLRFLGNVPMDPQVVMGGDSGRPYLSSGAGTAATKAFDVVLDNVIKELPVKIES